MKRALVWLGALFATAASAANAPIVLSSFGVNLNGGSDLYAGLVLDAAGNLYGTAESGGAHGSGVVFRLSPQAGGAWSETVLYSFLGGVEDGKTPHASLIWDGQSHLYGTTISGGIGLQSCSGGCGVVFQLTQTTGGHFTETAIYRFTGGGRRRSFRGINSGRRRQSIRHHHRRGYRWAGRRLQAFVFAGRRLDGIGPAQLHR